MPHKLTPLSIRRLATCEDQLQRVILDAAESFDFQVLCGHRGEKEQNDAFARKTSKVRWPNSKHNSKPSRAVDLIPWPIDWNDLKRFDAMMKVVKASADKLGVKVRFGNDFNQNGVVGDDRFIDRPHVELVNN